MILLQILDANKSICMPGTNNSCRKMSTPEWADFSASLGRRKPFARNPKKQSGQTPHPLGQRDVNESLYRSDDGLVL